MPARGSAHGRQLPPTGSRAAAACMQPCHSAPTLAPRLALCSSQRLRQEPVKSWPHPVPWLHAFCSLVALQLACKIDWGRQGYEHAVPRACEWHNKSIGPEGACPPAAAAQYRPVSPAHHAFTSAGSTRRAAVTLLSEGANTWRQLGRCWMRWK